MNSTALFFLIPTLGVLPAISQSVPGYAISNTKHYRESGVGNATGRSGSAHLTSRALLDKDGNTKIELTTGALDSTATPPGSFIKVQLKPLNPDGDAIFAQNFNGISTPNGYYSFGSTSLHRHQQAQIQTNIRGIDNRTDVVTLVETVKLLPDVAVQPLNLPDTIVNTPVTIHANLVELNGDASATATCQLIVDSALVDQASNIYIDAGGSVSCAFTYTFDAPGSHSVQVTAAKVVPADWDVANNTASGNINILGLNTNTAEHGDARFSDQKGGFPVLQAYTYQATYGGATVYSYGETTGNSGEQQSSQIILNSGGCAFATNATAYQFPVDINYVENMDGTPVYKSKASGITGNTSTFPANFPLCGGNAVSYLQQAGTGIADDHTFHVVSNTYYDSASKPLFVSQQVDGTRDAGDVTYFSYKYDCTWFTDCSTPPTPGSTPPDNYYVWNTNSVTALGTIVPVGSTWTASITATDASNAGFGGSMAVSLTKTQHTSTPSNSCSTRTDIYGYTYQTCNSVTNDYSLTEGSATY